MLGHVVTASVCASLLLVPATAVADPMPQVPGTAAAEAETLQRVGGFLSVAGWGGVALGTGFMIADGRSDSPFGPQEDDQLPPRGPIVIGIGGAFLVLGLSLALPPTIAGLEVDVTPTGTGVLVTGRF